MKKIFLLLLVGCCLLSSCSNDDDPANLVEQLTTNGTKLRKYVEKFANGNVLLSINYEYQGDKLNRMIYSNGQERKFFYTDDLITKIKDYGGNMIGATTYLSYNPEGKLSGIIVHHTDGLSGSAEYLYNTDNTVTVNYYNGDVESQDQYCGSNNFFLEDGVIVKQEGTRLNQMGETRTWTEDYTYDTKENPLNGIVGFDKLRLYFYQDVLIHYGCINNVVKTENVSSEFLGIHSRVNNFTYNDFGFPIKTSRTSDGNFAGTTEYYYEVP